MQYKCLIGIDIAGAVECQTRQSQSPLQPDVVRFVCYWQQTDNGPVTTTSRDRVTSSGDVTGDVTKTPMTLMAVKNYNPRYFSQSGRPDQELTLAEGDVVRQLGTTHVHSGNIYSWGRGNATS